MRGSFMIDRVFHRLLPTAVIAATAFALASCTGGVANEKDAQASYVGLNGAIGKAIQLGFDGFNAATSANIPPQSTTGDLTGTLDVVGQADQGASANKGMRLSLIMVDYEDEIVEDGFMSYSIVYDTDPNGGDTTSWDALLLPYLDLKFANYPDGTYSGTLTGPFLMSGDLDGEVVLDLMISGSTQAGVDAGSVERVVGSTTITGTATSQYGTFNVNLTL